ncbi:MAG: hypothetical protein IJ565_04825 [Bacilli bacterium]|nr:hypothetical protein [Bacilli bacterium]
MNSNNIKIALIVAIPILLFLGFLEVKYIVWPIVEDIENEKKYGSLSDEINFLEDNINSTTNGTTQNNISNSDMEIYINSDCTTNILTSYSTEEIAEKILEYYNKNYFTNESKPGCYKKIESKLQ